MEQATGIGRDRFQIAALRLGIEGGEGERRLAGSRHAGEHDQGVARDVHVNILEIMLARAPDADETGGRGVSHVQILTL
ncbi:hypothetical protein D3C86_1796100 [compost metagenome]